MSIDKTSLDYIANYDKLKHLYEIHPGQLVNILNSSSRICQSGQHEKDKYENRLLFHWIYEITSHMDQFKCGTAQRIHWILNDLTDFPQCKICGKMITNPKQFKTISTGYKQFCCTKCGKKSGSVKSKQTRFSKNNGKYFSDETIERQKHTFISHYGVDHNMKSDEGLKAYRAGVEKKYGTGIINPFQAQSVIEKIETTKLNRYGDAKYNNIEQALITLKNRSQTDIDAQWDSFKKTSLAHYGVDHPMKHHDVCNRSIENRTHSRYCIDNQYFDSKPEFCFYVCCRDFGIEIQCHPIDKALQYVDSSGKKHRYFPDFYIPSLDRLVEIKGNQFFKNHDEAMSLIDLYGKNDKTYNIAELKYKCMIENNVLIVSTQRYVRYERRVKRKYGNAWIKQHKVSPKRKKQLDVN